MINGTGEFDGIIDILADAGSGAVKIDQLKWVASGATTTSINALDAALQIFESCPPEIMLRDDLILVLGTSDYKMLVSGMVKENLYHYTGEVGRLTVPGTNITVVASSGIANNANGVNFKFLTSGNNIIMGTDLTSDFDEFKVWYSQDNDEVRSSLKWTIGVALVQPDLCVAVNEA